MTYKSKSDTDEAVGSCLMAIASFLIAPFSTIWRGYVLSILWRWFIVPTFDAHPLRIVEAIGLSFVIAFLAPYSPYVKDERPASERFFYSVGMAILHPAFALGFGAIASHWMQ